MEEMKSLFNPSDINKSASIYNAEKLDWLNAHYIKNHDNNYLGQLLESHDIFLLSHDKKEIILDAIKERAKTLKEMAGLINEILVTPEEYDEKALKKAFKTDSIDILKNFMAKLQGAAELHLPIDYHNVMQAVVDEMEIGFGKIGQPLRVALMGKLSGPGLDNVMAIIGVNETVARIEQVIAIKENGDA
jgi:glutamyl-tRNA synthetase